MHLTLPAANFIYTNSRTVYADMCTIYPSVCVGIRMHMYIQPCHPCHCNTYLTHTSQLLQYCRYSISGISNDQRLHMAGDKT